MLSMTRLVTAALLAVVAAPAFGQQLRVATYNCSLNRTVAGELIQDLSTPNDPQARQVAEILQRVDADVVLLNEFDFDAAGQALALFQQNYLAVSQNGQDPVDYPHVFLAPSNTGAATGFDLDNNGFAFQTLPEYEAAVAAANLPAFLAGIFYGNDAKGFGEFEGKFAMVVLSKFPIVRGRVRTFQNFLWQDMPGALLPVDPATNQSWYSQAELDVLPLSSKSHWDIPVRVGRRVIHVLAAHPTPPVFDGDEDRNGRRNHDEIRFWRDYVTPFRGGYIYDDDGRRGGLPLFSRFVIAGDYNADPLDGDSTMNAIDQLLESFFVDDRTPPTSDGGPEAAQLQGMANLSHQGDPALDTADFGDESPGNLRVDYVLPARFRVRHRAGGVFWPTTASPLSALVGASDHRLVWADLRLRFWL